MSTSVVHVMIWAAASVSAAGITPSVPAGFAPPSTIPSVHLPNCPSPGINAFVDGMLAMGCAAADWLDGQITHFSDLAKPKERRSTAKGLRHFADDLASIERDKRNLIATLRRGGDSADIATDLAYLTESVRRAQGTLDERLMPLLNAEYKRGGDSVYFLLSAAAGGKAEWLNRARERLPKMNEQQRTAFLAAGESAATVLHRAQIAARVLADSISP